MDHLVKVLLCLPLMIYCILEALVLLFIPKSLRYKDVRGETVLVTGAGSGVGRELAIKFSELGCRVILVDINQNWMEETRKIIKQNSGEVFSYHCDVSRREAVYQMAAKIKDEIGNVTILVNNAAVVIGKTFLDCPDEKIVKTFEVNTLAHFWTCKAFLPDMIQNNYGHIVSIASAAGHHGLPRLTDYCSSKFASVGFDESLRIEFIAENITGVKTTVVCPYQISTGLFEGFQGRLLGILTAEYVARETVSAVLVNQEVLLLPGVFRLLFLMKWLLPWSAMKVFLETFGLFNCMDNFTGRKEI